MTNAPERIWIDDARTYSATFFSAGIPYVRADLFDAMTAERDAALALVAAAYEAAARLFDEAEGEDIRALTPADAIAAQAARDERMRAEGAREAEARNVKLANALRPLAKAYDALISQAPDHRRLAFGGEILTYGDFRRARAALRENGD